MGGLASVAVLIVDGLVFFFFYRRTQEQNTRFDAAITRLQTGVLTQQPLVECSRRALEDGERSLVFTAASLAVLFRWKVPEPVLIACAAVAGLFLRHA